MAKLTRYDEVPLKALGRRAHLLSNNCNHRTLTYDGKQLKCVTCGKEWKDYLGGKQ